MKTTNKLFLLIMMLATLTTACKKEEMEPGRLVPVTVMEDPSLPYIEVNGTRLHAETFGNPADPILIILHGGPGSDYRYMLNHKAFADEGYFVVFFDQRGTGLSQRHDKEIYKGDTYVEDLRQVIAHYRLTDDQKVFLIGHSWGAMYATWYVNTYPEDIEGLVLSEPGGLNQSQVEEYMSRAFSPEFFAEWTNDIAWKDQFVTGQDNESMDYNYMLMNIRSVGTGDTGTVPFWRYGFVCYDGLTSLNEGFDWTTNLGSYTTKVLFMYSELNPAYGREYAMKVSSAFPNVDLHEIMGTGHELTYFAFDQYFALSKSYLNERMSNSN